MYISISKISLYNENVFRKRVENINPYEIQIIQLIFDSKLVHYRDIEQKIGKSRKTVNKYLNHIGSVVNQYNVQLVRKRAVGISFEGDVNHLRRALWEGVLRDNQYNVSQLRASILSELLELNNPVTVQDLSDKYFVSRATISKRIKELRLALQKENIELSSDTSGISIHASEKDKRLIISKMLEKYWGGTGKYEVGIQVNNGLSVTVPKELKGMFDKDTFDGVESILNEFQKLSDISLNDYEYQSLVVHLVIAIKRIEKGEMLTDDRFIRRQRYMEATDQLVGLLERYFNIKIPIEEKRYINIHVLAASKSNNKNQLLTNQELDGEKDVDNLIGSFLRINMMDYDDVLITNLTLHLIPALHRIALGLRIENPYTSEVKQNFAHAYNEAVDLGMAIKKEFNVHVNDDELAYIALHIEAFLERYNKKLTAVIVCSTGLGTAKLLEQRVNKYFSDRLIINRVMSISELQNTDVSEDLIISTVRIEFNGKKVIVVPPFLDSQSRNNIQMTLENLIEYRPKESSFMSLIHENLIMVDDEVINKEESINKISELVVENGYGKQGISKAAVAREELGSTQIDFIAIPHAPIEFVNKPCIAIYINSKGVDWSDGKINIIFFLAMNNEIKDEVDAIYSYFNNLLEDKQLLQRIIHLTDKKEIMKMLGSEVSNEQ